MFGNKKNINILVALLIKHGVKRAVVCPGSRNAPIVHTLNECEDIACYPVTDERSAGFYALGMSLADNAPVVVCVTSGTALLNLAPAVAEASYLHHGLIVISADRPSAWIGQLDGQTLPQPGVFGCFASMCVNLPEPHDDIELWHCRRLVNEALCEVKANGNKSVHINVPISEPLFEFNTDELPTLQKIETIRAALNTQAFENIVLPRMFAAKRPMIVVGQLSEIPEKLEQALAFVSNHIAVLSEPLSFGMQRPFDLVLARTGEAVEYSPDFLLYIGDTIISKRLKNYLRETDITEVWAVSEDGKIHDTFMQLSGVIEGCSTSAIMCIADFCEKHIAEIDDNNTQPRTCFADKWKKCMDDVCRLISGYEPRYSQMAAIRDFELSLEDMDYAWHVHYANSNAVRLACIYSTHHVWCNRGVNGIEGSLSTAAGFSVATDDMVFCIIGDLSFFYDQNALWNSNIKGNLRIILLNNGCGGIFYSLGGLRESSAFSRLVSAHHDTTAQGICTQNDIGYLSAKNNEELHVGIATLMTSQTTRPILLEVFTDAEEDKLVINDFMKYIKS